MKVSPADFIPRGWPQWVFCVLISAVLVQNVAGFGELYIGLSEEINRINGLSKVLSHQKIGYQFSGLEEFTSGIDRIGYYSDDNLELNEHAHKLFAHAQYVLAPTVLELDNMDHEFVLLVCSNPKSAGIKLKQLNALPLRANKFGMILARRIR